MKKRPREEEESSDERKSTKRTREDVVHGDLLETLEDQEIRFLDIRMRMAASIGNARALGRHMKRGQPSGKLVLETVLECLKTNNSNACRVILNHATVRLPDDVIVDVRDMTLETLRFMIQELGFDPTDSSKPRTTYLMACVLQHDRTELFEYLSQRVPLDRLDTRLASLECSSIGTLQALIKYAKDRHAIEKHADLFGPMLGSTTFIDILAGKLPGFCERVVRSGDGVTAFLASKKRWGNGLVVTKEILDAFRHLLYYGYTPTVSHLSSLASLLSSEEKTGPESNALWTLLVAAHINVPSFATFEDYAALVEDTLFKQPCWIASVLLDHINVFKPLSAFHKRILNMARCIIQTPPHPQSSARLATVTSLIEDALTPEERGALAGAVYAETKLAQQ